MKEISATEAARGFADVLDAVQHRGESFVVRRNGRVVARIEPATGADGRTVKHLLASGPHDQRWADELRALRDTQPAEVTTWEG
ncbi:MAG TPA: type II toxin-antitoxin system Phd/YefM family antitoxin [Actinomycetota bacterium]